MFVLPEQEGETFTVEVVDILPELQVKPDRFGGSDDRRCVLVALINIFFKNLDEVCWNTDLGA